MVIMVSYVIFYDNEFRYLSTFRSSTKDINRLIGLRWYLYHNYTIQFLSTTLTGSFAYDEEWRLYIYIYTRLRACRALITTCIPRTTQTSSWSPDVQLNIFHGRTLPFCYGKSTSVARIRWRRRPENVMPICATSLLLGSVGWFSWDRCIVGSVLSYLMTVNTGRVK